MRSLGGAELDPDAPVLIRAQGVGKRFHRHSRRATSLKERVIRREQGPADDFWALKGVDVVVRRGETVGLMGPNGSGKSTLLKVLSGILRQTEGTVSIEGRVASLLELGAGFDGELTGRENVYLNSALLGVPRPRPTRLFDEIVAFSELGEFIDNPVKHYSSGMYVRLGFAVAVHIDPDILIVDEVLAVGDAAFQKKCLDRIGDFQQQGKTILFVSHSAQLVEQLCTRAVLLSHGQVIFDGPTREGGDPAEPAASVSTSSTASVGSCATVTEMRRLRPRRRAAARGVRVRGPSGPGPGRIEWTERLPKGAKLSLHFTSPAQRNPVIEVEPLLAPARPGRGVPRVHGVRLDHRRAARHPWRLHAQPRVYTDESSSPTAASAASGCRVRRAAPSTGSSVWRVSPTGPADRRRGRSSSGLDGPAEVAAGRTPPGRPGAPLPRDSASRARRLSGHRQGPAVEQPPARRLGVGHSQKRAWSAEHLARDRQIVGQHGHARTRSASSGGSPNPSSSRGEDERRARDDAPQLVVGRRPVSRSVRVGSSSRSSASPQPPPPTSTKGGHLGSRRRRSGVARRAPEGSSAARGCRRPADTELRDAPARSQVPRAAASRPTPGRRPGG